MREALGKMKVDAMVVTALDEVAWLFNMRGNDIPYTPVFRAYAVVDEKKAILYLPPEKQAFHVKEHLRSQVSYRKGKPGKRQLRRAVSLISFRSVSMETINAFS